MSWVLHRWGSTLILAQDEQLLRSLRLSDQINWLSVLMLVLGITLFGALLYYCRRWFRETPPEPEGPRDYLVAACESMSLSTQERNDLSEIARYARLPHPASLMLSPANLAAALRRAQPHIADPGVGKRARGLAVKLFGRPLPETPEQPPH